MGWGRRCWDGGGEVRCVCVVRCSRIGGITSIVLLDILKARRRDRMSVNLHYSITTDPQ